MFFLIYYALKKIQQGIILKFQPIHLQLVSKLIIFVIIDVVV
jgi:hypothetical protein